jgi:hypothetical protein
MVPKLREIGNAEKVRQKRDIRFLVAQGVGVPPAYIIKNDKRARWKRESVNVTSPNIAAAGRARE